MKGGKSRSVEGERGGVDKGVREWREAGNGGREGRREWRGDRGEGVEVRRREWRGRK